MKILGGDAVIQAQKVVVYHYTKYGARIYNVSYCVIIESFFATLRYFLELANVHLEVH